MGAKQQVLELLERSRGQHVSGERIAELLGVSRNTVWRAIKELQGDGYEIQAVTNRGYCLGSGNDLLSVQGIAPHLWAPELARRVEVFASLSSTNQLAKERAVAGAAHGTAILADHQTAGRGRRGRAFLSPAGRGLYLSLVLDPVKLGFGNPTSVTAWAAVCVCRALEEVCGLAPGIKWVNDILLDGRKVCGILTEAISDFESGGVSAIVLGIGLNVTGGTEDFPEELRGIAGSLYPDGNPPVTRNRIAAELINRLGAGEPPQEDALFAEYRRRLCMLGAGVTVLRGEERFSATALDVDARGHLIVRADSGEVLTLQSGEVSLRL